MADFFRLIFIQPMFNLLVGLTNVLPGSDLGLAIIVLTIGVRCIFLPLTLRAHKSQKALSELQPLIKAVQDKHKGDQQKIGKEMMDLYKKHGVNPLSGCLPLLIQLPVVIALYRALLWSFQSDKLNTLYSFVHNPGVVPHIAFGFLDLSQKSPSLAVLAGGLQFIHSRIAMRSQSVTDPKSPTAQMSRQMMFMLPVMILFISWSLPAGLALYIVVSTLFSLFEHWLSRRSHNAGTAGLAIEPSK